MKQKEVSLKSINLRLRKHMKRIGELYDELQTLEDMIVAPTPAEFEEMVRGTRPLTLEALMIGVIADASFHLSESRVSLDRYGPYTPIAFAKSEHRFWRDHLQEVLGHVVRSRARRPVVMLDSKEEPSGAHQDQALIRQKDALDRSFLSSREGAVEEPDHGGQSGLGEPERTSISGAR